MIKVEVLFENKDKQWETQQGTLLEHFREGDDYLISVIHLNDGRYVRYYEGIFVDGKYTHVERYMEMTESYINTQLIDRIRNGHDKETQFQIIGE